MTNTNKSTKKRLKTLTKKRDARQELVIKELERCPIIQVACARANIGRSTYYEWIRDDKEFSELSKKAIEIGHEIVTDLAESKLVENIQKGNITAIIFRLKNFNPRYSEKRLFGLEHPEIEVTKEEREAINFALYNIGLGEIIRMNNEERKVFEKKIKENDREETEEEIIHSSQTPPVQEKVGPKKDVHRKKRGMVNISEALGLYKKKEN